MTEQELREYMAARKLSPHVERTGTEGLTCFGCAHSAAGEPPPGKPSGERPCCACVRNPERGEWRNRARMDGRNAVFLTDDQGNARCFDPWLGTQYNGVPFVYHPSDRYVTLDSFDQDRWLERHPEYDNAVTHGTDGQVRVVGREP